jgi:hypothetical protein
MKYDFPCPTCTNMILIDSDLLIKGKKFVCRSCSFAIYLLVEGNKATKEATERLRLLRESTDDHCRRYRTWSGVYPKSDTVS